MSRTPRNRLSVIPAVLCSVVLSTIAPPLPTEAAAAQPSACTSAPFVSRPATRTWYRVPAIVRTGSGALVAFAERRDSDRSDLGNFDIVSRTSLDGGCSWRPMVTVGNWGRDRVSNPVPVWDENSGSILLLSSVRRVKTDSYVGLFLQRSSDDGATWTPLASGQVRVQGGARTWKGGLTGPGHGLVLRTGVHAGRVIFAMGYRTGGRYGAYGIYSDDGGTSWRIGYDRLSPGNMKLIEGTIAELADGRLLVSYRDLRKTKPGTNRVSAISTDGGQSISAFRRMTGVKTMAVQGSLLQTGSGKVLFSSPSFTRTANLTIRKDMRIFVSTNSGAAWHAGPLIGGKGRPAAYSDLVEIDPARVGLLYETGVKKWRERIVFVQVPVSSLR